MYCDLFHGYVYVFHIFAQNWCGTGVYEVESPEIGKKYMPIWCIFNVARALQVHNTGQIWGPNSKTFVRHDESFDAMMSSLCHALTNRHNFELWFLLAIQKKKTWNVHLPEQVVFHVVYLKIELVMTWCTYICFGRICIMLSNNTSDMCLSNAQ